MDRFIIGPTGGLETDLKPWLIPDQAMATLNNAYVFRGRIRKRFGSQWMGDDKLLTRLRITMGTITGGTLAGNVRTINNDSGMPTAVGQAFSVGSVFFTIVNPAAGNQQMLRSDGSVAPATYNLTTSDFNITGVVAPDGTTVFFYPAFPVMGLDTYEQYAINNEITIAFDTRYAYTFTSGVGWDRLKGETNAGDAVWTGSNSQFFWGTNWTGVSASDKNFFVTNDNQNEPNFMRYFKTSTNKWTRFRPVINAGGDTLDAALILLPFRNRLIAFNTWEKVSGSLLNFQNRARYSWVGDPTDTVNGWLQDTPGRGNAIDAPTTEAIISAEFIKDRLIVFFERSTYEFAYTGNQAYPFQWYKINTELGAESTFSIVPFDKVTLGVGNVGIHACNGANVERIDSKIPDTVFDIHNADAGVERVYGIRDYFVEMVYWTFPGIDRGTNFPYPNRVLTYNYKTDAWAFNDDSFTVFGYFFPQTGVTWDSTTVTWDDPIAWDAGPTQALFRQVIAGNQEGYVVIINPDIPVNAPALQINNITLDGSNNVVIQTIDHNLSNLDYIRIQDLNGLTPIAPLTMFDPIYQVSKVVDNKNFQIIAPQVQASLLAAQTYKGGGVIARVSKIDITTKQFNFYLKQGRNAAVQKVDFQVDRTDEGEVYVAFYTSSADQDLAAQGIFNNAIVGDSILETFPYALYPYEQLQDRLMHPIYLQANGEFVQVQITMNDALMRKFTVDQDGTTISGPTYEDFQLHSMIFYATPTSSRLE